MDFFQFNTVTEVLNKTQMLLKLLLKHEVDWTLWFMIVLGFFVVFPFPCHCPINCVADVPTSSKSIYWEVQQAFNRERDTGQQVSGIQELQAPMLRSAYNINGAEEAEMKSWLKLHWFNITPFHSSTSFHCILRRPNTDIKATVQPI